MGFNSVFNDNNFFERIRNSHQRILLLQHFFLIRNGKCRLNIITLIRLIANKIYFRLNSHRFAVFVFTVFNDAYINVESCLRNQIGIAQIFEIMIDCVGMKRDLFYAFKGIRQFFGVGKRADRGR